MFCLLANEWRVIVQPHCTKMTLKSTLRICMVTFLGYISELGARKTHTVVHRLAHLAILSNGLKEILHPPLDPHLQQSTNRRR